MYNNLYEIHRDSTLIDDDTIIIISIEDERTGLQCRLARGNWYNDDVLEHIHKEIVDMKVLPTENKIFCRIIKVRTRQSEETKRFILMWQHEYDFTNAAGEFYAAGECQDCGSFDTREEAVAFAHKHLPKSANWDVFTREYLLDDVTEWTTERLIDEYKSNSGIWDTKVLQEICKRADMVEEWEAANGETFERVVQLAVFTLEEG